MYHSDLYTTWKYYLWRYLHGNIVYTTCIHLRYYNTCLNEIINANTNYTSPKYVWCVCICTNYGMNDTTRSIWMELILVGFPLTKSALPVSVKWCHCTSPKCIELVFATKSQNRLHFSDAPGPPTKAAKHSPYKSARVKAEIPLSAFKSGLTLIRRNGKMELWKMDRRWMVFLWMLGGMEKHKLDKQKKHLKHLKLHFKL